MTTNMTMNATNTTNMNMNMNMTPTPSARGSIACSLDLQPQPADDPDWVRRMHHRAIFQVNEALHTTIHTPRTEDRWACLKRDRRFEMHARRNNTARSVCFLAVNEIFCGFEDVHKLLRFETTPEFQYAMKLLYGRSFRDGALEPVTLPLSEADTDSDVIDAVHAKVAMRLQERQRAALGREHTLRFFQALMILHPDCFDMNMNTNVNGSTVSLYTRPSESIKKRTLAFAWLPLSETSDIMAQREPSDVRLQYTLIVEEVSNHRLRVSCVATCYRDGDDAHSSRASRTMARRLASRLISNLDSAVNAMRMSTRTPIAPHQWVRDEDRASCVICWKPFNSVFRRRHHCRMCGEVVCGWCSSLRCANGSNSNELERVRMCHMCSNLRRRKNDSFASTSTMSQAFPATSTATDEEPFSSSRYPSLCSLPYGLPSEDVVERSGDEDDERVAREEKESKARLSITDEIGPQSCLSMNVTASKIISIKNLPRSATTRRSVPPAFFSLKPNRPKHRRQSVDGALRVSSCDGPRRRHSDISSMSFLHPDPKPNSMTSVTAEFGSGKKAEELDDLSSSGMPRRTSIMSLGMLDGLVGEELAQPVRIDPAVEASRLKLMKVICSPACTLVDRELMRRCCEIVAATFNVEAAFIARVEEKVVVIEHAIGSKQLAPNDCFRRSSTLCDYVLVQDGEPFFIMDCATDSRACVRENAMARDLGMRFFAGTSIRVRGLPIACLCTFQPSSGDGDETEPLVDDVTSQQLDVLQQAAREIERDLDQLVRGLVLF